MYRIFIPLVMKRKHYNFSLKSTLANKNKESSNDDLDTTPSNRTYKYDGETLNSCQSLSNVECKNAFTQKFF